MTEELRNIFSGHVPNFLVSYVDFVLDPYYEGVAKVVATEVLAKRLFTGPWLLVGSSGWL